MTEKERGTDNRRRKDDGDHSRRWFWEDQPEIDRTKKVIISDDEVFALLEFAANNNVKKEQIKVIKALSKEIHKPVPDPSEVAALYAGLVATTKPVTGSTVIDSQRSFFRRLSGLAVVTTTFFVLAIGNSIADNWIADIVDADEDQYWFGFNWLATKTYIWDYLAPFFYGALGTCVYLMKAIQDSVKDYQYDDHYMEGWGTRVLIGGILATIILILFDPATLSSDTLPLSSTAIAFLTGLGVKPVYGALEKTIELISDKLNLDSIRRVPAYKTPDPKVATSEAETKQGDGGA